MVAAWALVRSFGLESGYPMVPLIAYTPVVFLVSLAALVIALAVRQWGAALLAGAAVLALAIAIFPRLVSEDDPGPGPRIGVMAVNVLHGDADPAELMALLRSKRPHLLTVQELTPDYARRLDAAGIRALFPHSVLDPVIGVSGSGIYARGPATPLDSAGERFAQTRAAVALNGTRLDVTSVHPVPPTGPAAIRRWQRTLAGLPGPAAQPGALALLAGDFNATLDHSAFRELLDRGYVDAAERTGNGLEATWPRMAKPFRYLPVTIDHIVVEEGVGISAYEVLDVEGSDHRAVYAELVVEDQSAPPSGGQRTTGL